MNRLAALVGLLGAITLAPLPIGAQEHLSISYGESHGGLPHYDYPRWQVDASCESIPYAYLWNGYCEENARHYACRMQHALDAAAVARNAVGACPAEKWNLLMERIGSITNGGGCSHGCHGPDATGCGDCLDSLDHDGATESSPESSQPTDSGTAGPAQEPARLLPIESSTQPTQPPASETTDSNREVHEPIRLLPVESPPRRLVHEPPTTSWSPRSPVVRLAPAAPQPSRMRPNETQSPPRREQRIPRNVIPRIPRNEIPPRPAHRRNAALPVKTKVR
jgi:hypothetical protein